MKELETTRATQTRADRIHAQIQNERGRRVETSFSAYMQDRSSANEDALLRPILMDLISKAKQSFRAAWGAGGSDGYGDSAMAAEERARDIAIEIGEKLRADLFPSHLSLMALVGLKISFLFQDGLIAKDKYRLEQPFPARKSADGEEFDTGEIERRKKGLVFTPSSEPEADDDHEPIFAFVPVSTPHNYFTRENAFLRGYLPEPDVQLFEALEDCGWNREAACRLLQIEPDALDKRINRAGQRMQRLRCLLTAFHLPMEHRHDLADRFKSLVDTLTASETDDLPKNFAEAFALCAKEQQPAIQPAQTRRERVVKHLQKIWRAQTIQ